MDEIDYKDTILYIIGVRGRCLIRYLFPICLIDRESKIMNLIGGENQSECISSLSQSECISSLSQSKCISSLSQSESLLATRGRASHLFTLILHFYFSY